LNDPESLRREAAVTRARITANVNACEQRLRTYVPGASGNGNMRVLGDALVERAGKLRTEAFQLLWAGATTGYKVARWWRNRTARRRASALPD